MEIGGLESIMYTPVQITNSIKTNHFRFKLKVEIKPSPEPGDTVKKKIANSD